MEFFRNSVGQLMVRDEDNRCYHVVRESEGYGNPACYWVSDEEFDKLDKEL